LEYSGSYAGIDVVLGPYVKTLPVAGIDEGEKIDLLFEVPVVPPSFRKFNITVDIDKEVLELNEENNSESGPYP